MLDGRFQFDRFVGPRLLTTKMRKFASRKLNNDSCMQRFKISDKLTDSKKYTLHIISWYTWRNLPRSLSSLSLTSDTVFAAHAADRMSCASFRWVMSGSVGILSSITRRFCAVSSFFDWSIPRICACIFNSCAIAQAYSSWWSAGVVLPWVTVVLPWVVRLQRVTVALVSCACYMLFDNMITRRGNEQRDEYACSLLNRRLIKASCVF